MVAKYIYNYPNWTQFTWNEVQISLLLGEVRYLQGKISGQMRSVGFKTKSEASLETLTQDVLKTSEIEGEQLNSDQVRSSIARKLGFEEEGIAPKNKNVEGIVELMLDATLNYDKPITKERLFGWHAALFPTGFSGLYAIEVAKYRTGEMQIVSSAMGKEIIHFEAVSASNVELEMNCFLEWVNSQEATTSNNQISRIDYVLKAAIAHFWFIIIHPFDDGNGRIARALSDLLLARSENTSERFFSLSNQILLERKQYYSILQEAQHSSGDITPWLVWFLTCLKNALLETELSLQRITEKFHFWEKHEKTPLNERQRMMLNKLMDGFEGKLKSSKWAKITKCSPDTALRDIKDLIEKGILVQEAGGGRSTNYELVVND